VARRFNDERSEGEGRTRDVPQSVEGIRVVARNRSDLESDEPEESLMSSNTEVFDLVGNAGHHGHGGRARRTKEGVPQFPVQILIPEETREALRRYGSVDQAYHSAIPCSGRISSAEAGPSARQAQLRRRLDQASRRAHVAGRWHLRSAKPVMIRET
jgi:hypothetical protein